MYLCFEGYFSVTECLSVSFKQGKNGIGLLNPLKTFN